MQSTRNELILAISCKLCHDKCCTEGRIFTTLPIRQMLKEVYILIFYTFNVAMVDSHHVRRA